MQSKYYFFFQGWKTNGLRVCETSASWTLWKPGGHISSSWSVCPIKAAPVVPWPSTAALARCHHHSSKSTTSRGTGWLECASAEAPRASKGQGPNWHLVKKSKKQWWWWCLMASSPLNRGDGMRLISPMFAIYLTYVSYFSVVFSFFLLLYPTVTNNPWQRPQTLDRQVSYASSIKTSHRYRDTIIHLKLLTQTLGKHTPKVGFIDH